MNGRVPAEVFPPGEYIRDELEARGWTQADLAFILDRPLQAVNEIIVGRKSITPETAKGLAEAFGTSAEIWMNLESAYRLNQAKDCDDVARRAKLYAVAPVKALVKRRWISEAADAAILEGELLRFFDVKTIDEQPEFCVAARMSTPYSTLTPAHTAWFCRAKRLAHAVSAANFSPDRLKAGLADLHKLTASEHDVRRVPALLAGLGVRMVVVEHLPKTRIDGAALWLDEGMPAIALSLRYDRIDCFWFTLCHELMHILRGDRWSLDDALVGEDSTTSDEKPEYELMADRDAADFLVPPDEIEGFIKRTRPLYSKKRIIKFANRIQVHPGIITGQLQRRAEVGYGFGREWLVKVRTVVRDAALSDGWGDVPPIT